MSLQSILILTLVVTITLSALILLRFLWILPSFNPQPPSPRKSSAKLLIVLGSGGHTAEMLRLLQSLNFDKYTRRTYIISSGDTLSESKARHLELSKTDENNTVASKSYIPLIVVV
jgi:beta-1,4-N-acetylglucosaminyltransferase